jgi:hypothetical protein
MFMFRHVQGVDQSEERAVLAEGEQARIALTVTAQKCAEGVSADAEFSISAIAHRLREFATIRMLDSAVLQGLCRSADGFFNLRGRRPHTVDSVRPLVQGEAARYCTVRVTVPVLVIVPDVPVMVSV